MSEEKLTWEKLAQKKGLSKNETFTTITLDDGYDLPPFAPDPYAETVAQQHLSPEKVAKNEQIRATRLVDELPPDVVDFSPQGLSEAMKRQVESYLSRSIHFTISPPWNQNFPNQNGNGLSLKEFAEQQILSTDVDSEAWENFTLLALPPSPGFAAALTIAVRNIHRVSPIVVHFQQPYPDEEPTRWLISGFEDFN